MRKYFTLVIITSLLMITRLSTAQILLEENFDYPAGDTIGSYGWVTFSGTVNPLTVVSPGLTYTGYPLSGIGNAVEIKNNGYDAYKALSSDVTSDNLYTAFMVNLDNATTAGDYFLAYLPSTSTTNYNGRVYVKDSLGFVAFGLSRTTAASGSLVYTPAVFQYETTYLLVLKYSFNPGTNDDEVSLFVLTQPLIPPVEPTLPTIGPLGGTSTDIANIGRVALRQGTSSSSPELILDGIRSFVSWEKLVVSVNPISSIAEDFKLYQNYPNPFNPSTTIKFSVPGSGNIVLNIYNSLGQLVSELANSSINAGSYSVEFNGKELNSGVYFYNLTYTGNNGVIYTDSKKLLLIK